MKALLLALLLPFAVLAQQGGYTSPGQNPGYGDNRQTVGGITSPTISGQGIVVDSASFDARRNPWSLNEDQCTNIAGYQAAVPANATRDGLGACNCNSGYTLNGIFCEAGTCTTPWGSTIASGSGATAYQLASVPYGSTCASEVRICSAGTLTGSFTNAACTVAPPSNCTLPWGGTLTNGSSVVAYGSTCMDIEARVCTNGTLSGSYTNQTCGNSGGACLLTASCPSGYMPIDPSCDGKARALFSSNGISGANTVTITGACFPGSGEYLLGRYFSNINVSANHPETTLASGVIPTPWASQTSSPLGNDGTFPISSATAPPHSTTVYGDCFSPAAGSTTYVAGIVGYYYPTFAMTSTAAWKGSGTPAINSITQTLSPGAVVNCSGPSGQECRLTAYGYARFQTTGSYVTIQSTAWTGLSRQLPRLGCFACDTSSGSRYVNYTPIGGGDPVCTTCVAGATVNAAKNGCECNGPSTSAGGTMTSCTPCDGGKTWNASLGACTCPSGQYVAGAGGSLGCQACPAASPTTVYNSATASCTCSGADAGKSFNANNGTCGASSSWVFLADTVAIWNACPTSPSGKACGSPGATCEEPNGSFARQYTCACAAGYYIRGGACTACPAASPTTVYNAGTRSCTCSGVDAGKSFNAATGLCESKVWQFDRASSGGNSACPASPANKSCATVGTSCDEFVSCSMWSGGTCLSGNYNTYRCDCNAGDYLKNGTTCTACPTSNPTTTFDATRNPSCYCSGPDAGRYFNAATTKCTDMGAYVYLNNAASNTAGTGCNSATAGAACTAPGASCGKRITPTNYEIYRCSCPSGKYFNSATGYCTSCPVSSPSTSYDGTTGSCTCTGADAGKAFLSSGTCQPYGTMSVFDEVSSRGSTPYCTSAGTLPGSTCVVGVTADCLSARKPNNKYDRYRCQ